MFVCVYVFEKEGERAKLCQSISLKSQQLTALLFSYLLILYLLLSCFVSLIYSFVCQNKVNKVLEQ